MTAPMWCPSAARAPLAGLRGCGPMLGGPPRAVHHTTEGSTIAGAESTYAHTGDYPHLTVDYAKDVVHQHIPANVGATALKNAAGGVQTNRQGLYCVQIEWVGQAAHPFTSGRTAGPNVRALLDWLRALGIPDAWPMGAPLPYPRSYGLNNGDRDQQVWTARAGHYGHSQVPENDHGDPGAIEPAFVRQTAQPHPAVKPTPLPHQESRMIVRFAGHPEVYEVVGSHLEHITAQAYAARGRPPVTDLPATHALAQLPRTDGAA